MTTAMRTLREARIGQLTLRLISKGDSFAGALIASGKIRNTIDGTDADDVWERLTRNAAKADPGYVGYEGAQARFLGMFPGGFRSETYIETERIYKVKASEKLNEAAPLDAVAGGEGYTEALLKAFGSTNLVYPVEKARARDMLRGPDGDRFARAAARFTLNPMAVTLREMETVLQQYANARWTVVTYLPFLWAGHRHMFLKPQVTRDFARRVGHSFANVYDSRLDFAIYEVLLQLIAETETEIAVLGPQDRIDTQSFIWVAGEYTTADIPSELSDNV